MFSFAKDAETGFSILISNVDGKWGYVIGIDSMQAADEVVITKRYTLAELSEVLHISGYLAAARIESPLTPNVIAKLALMAGRGAGWHCPMCGHFSEGKPMAHE